MFPVSPVKNSLGKKELFETAVEYSFAKDEKASTPSFCLRGIRSSLSCLHWSLALAIFCKELWSTEVWAPLSCCCWWDGQHESSPRDALGGFCASSTLIKLQSSLRTFLSVFALSVASFGPCINLFMSILPLSHLTLKFSCQELSKMRGLDFQPWIDRIYIYIFINPFIYLFFNFSLPLLSELLVWKQLISFSCGM